MSRNIKATKHSRNLTRRSRYRQSNVANKERCGTCRQIVRLLTEIDPAERGRLKHHLRLDAITHVAETSCKRHPILISKCLGVRLGPGSELDSVDIQAAADEDHIYILGRKGYDYFFRQSGELKVLPSSGGLVNRKWIAHSLPRRWKRRCDEEHGGVCTAPSPTGNLGGAVVLPSRVIDTWQQCVIPCTSSTPYVALSYVWGGTSSLVALKANIQFLQEPSVLETGDGFADMIPLTIKHAMAFVREKMDERYLWVDSLCIVQDDESKMSEIMKMGAIYANASITIIASDGENANAGLLGLAGISNPRSVKQVVHRGLVQGAPPLLETYSARVAPGKSIWATRGWTFQEALLPKRKITFDSGWLRWSCRLATWDEHGEIPQHGPTLELTRLVPNMYQLETLVATYSTKKLTFFDDSLLAFSGIASALSTSFSGGFISCLPVQSFYMALLWQPMSAATRKMPQKGTEQNTILPSWTWAGWHSDRGMRLRRVTGYVKASRTRSQGAIIERVRPLVEWSSSNTLLGPWTIIRDHWHGNKDRYWNRLDTPCPPGWTRHPVAADWEHLPPHERARQPVLAVPSLCYYKHESEPDSEFWFPPPLPETNDRVEQHILSRYVGCRTRTSYLTLGSKFTAPHTGFTMVSVHGLQGQWAGVVGFDGNQEDEGQQQGVVELVEIAKGSTLNDAREYERLFNELEEWDLEERPKDGVTYEYYYVLCIKRGEMETTEEEEDGDSDGKSKAVVASRIGVGRIHERAWERQKLEWMSLVLQ